MLLKLIKMKLRSQRTLFWITLCSMPTLAALLTASCYMLYYQDHTDGYQLLQSVLAMSGAGLFFISILLFFGVFFAMTFAIMYSVYEMYGTHNAYLYFTLPIERRTVYHANIISHLIQLVVLYFITAVSVLIFMLGTQPVFHTDLFKVAKTYVTITDIFNGVYLFAGNTASYRALSIISWIVSTVWQLVSVQLACIFGCSLSKKHTLLGSIFSMFVISSITGFASIFLFIFSLFLISDLPEAVQESSSIILGCMPILMTAAFCVVGYFITIKRLEKRFDVK